MKVTTMRGAVLDITQILAQNETAIALGNAKMNARGDLIGPGGQVVKRKEQVAQDYHKQNPKSVKRVGLNDVQPDYFPTPQELIAKQKEEMAKRKKIVDSDN